MTSDERDCYNAHYENKYHSQLQRPGCLAKGNRTRQANLSAHKQFPWGQKFGLIAQMRQAAVSISSNIAEGQARHKTGEFIQFISHAEGSLAELDTKLIISIELRFANAGMLKPLSD